MSNPRVRRELELWADTDALYSMVPTNVLADLGIEPRRRLSFELADGRNMERNVGEARFWYDGRDTASPVISGEGGDASVLGVVTLEALGMEVDPLRGQIRPARLILY